MKAQKVFRLKKGGRVVYPYTAAEMRTRSDHRRCHTQIVRRDSIEVVKEVRFST